MSSLTSCNYCNMRRLKDRAKKRGMIVKTLPGRFMGGIEVFIVPKGTTTDEISMWEGASNILPNGDENHCKYWKAWFMELPNHCCC